MSPIISDAQSRTPQSHSDGISAPANAAVATAKATNFHEGANGPGVKV